MVELVDAPDLGSGAFGRVSSSLIRRTFFDADSRGGYVSVFSAGYNKQSASI